MTRKRLMTILGVVIAAAVAAAAVVVVIDVLGDDDDPGTELAEALRMAPAYAARSAWT